MDPVEDARKDRRSRADLPRCTVWAAHARPMPREAQAVRKPSATSSRATGR